MIRTLTVLLLIATTAGAGNVNIGGFWTEAPGDSFGSGVGWQIDYEHPISGPWFAVGGVSHVDYNMHPYGWTQSSPRCFTTISYDLSGSLSDTRLFLGGGRSLALPYGISAAAVADVGYDVVNANIQDTLTIGKFWRTTAFTHSFDADNTITGRLMLRLSKPLGSKAGVNASLGYTYDFDPQQIAGFNFDMSGWQASVGVRIGL